MRIKDAVKPISDRDYGTSAVVAACLSAKSSSDETSGVSPPTGSISGFENVHCFSALLKIFRGNPKTDLRSLGTMLSASQVLNSRGKAYSCHWAAMTSGAVHQQEALRNSYDSV